jgi:anionic cell wall polymer biosynthesis LytR-Cps2A-Psr (LCP) family protein
MTDASTDLDPTLLPEADVPDTPKRRRRSRLFTVLVTLAVVIVVVAAGAGGFGLYLANKLDNNINRVGDVFAPLPKAQRPVKTVAKAMNIVLVGSDARSGDTTSRSDTIMIMHIPADRASLTVVSIPRDSWVDIPGRGKAKVNAAFAYGGPTLLIATVEKLTGVAIDHYAEIDFAGFKSMTDAVGGVQLDGQQLDGEKALTYVRERKSLPRGDFDRIERQQRFLQALMARSTSKLTDPVALTRLLDAVTRSIGVDNGFTGGQMRSLALSLRSVRGGDVHFLTVPVTGTGREGDQSVVYLDTKQGPQLWKSIRDDAPERWW